MSQRVRHILLWIGGATFVVLLVGGIYAYFTFSQITAEYRSRAEFLSWVFQDQVSFDLDRGQDHDLSAFVGQLAVGNVFYAQIITDDGISEKNLLQVEIPNASPPNEVLEIERISLNGQSIWDIKRQLAYADGFVRLGINLAPLERTINMQTLILIGFGLALIAITGLAASLLVPREPDRSSDSSVSQSDLERSSSERQETGAPEPVHTLASHAETEQSAARPAPSSSTSEQTDSAVSSNHHAQAIEVGALLIDNASKRVEHRGNPVELSPKEFELIYLLAREPGRVFSNQEILDHVWADSHMATAQDVKQYIYFVRQKLEEDPKKPSLVVTVRGFGYKLQN